MTFIPIDLATWARRDYFYYFTKMQPTGFSVTANLDVTTMQQAAKAQGFRFFPTFLYLTTKVISQMPEFMVAQQEGVLGHFDDLTPNYSIVHPDDHSITGMWTEYTANLASFHAAYLDDITTYQDVHGPVAKSEPAPANSYMIGAMPDLHFANYTPLVFNGLPNYLPIIQAGQFQEADGRLVMPLSFTIHHAVADGYHVSQFYQQLQTSFDQPAKW